MKPTRNNSILRQPWAATLSLLGTFALHTTATLTAHAAGAPTFSTLQPGQSRVIEQQIPVNIVPCPDYLRLSAVDPIPEQIVPYSIRIFSVAGDFGGGFWLKSDSGHGGMFHVAHRCHIVIARRVTCDGSAKSGA